MSVAGFWSYSHDDDERDGHRLLRLAARIQDEFALVTGETLTLFVDRDAISWGDEWRRRIETALAETTFFIPVITPLYFKRHECRRELLSFVGQAQSLGAMELVMPILYVGVSDLVEDSSDEARALVARMQYVDWRELRLSDENSSEYRRRVNELALRLAEIRNRYEQSANEPSAADSDAEEEEDEEGLFDLLAIVEQKLPGWREFVDDGNATSDQVVAIEQSYVDRLRRIEKSRAAGPRLIILRKFAHEVEPLMQRSIEDAKNYAAMSIELDPIILKALRVLDVYPEASPGVLATLNPIEDIARTIIEDQAIPSPSKDFLDRYKGISKDFARLVRLSDVIGRYEDDGNSLVLSWNQAIQEYKKHIQGERQDSA